MATAQKKPTKKEAKKFIQSKAYFTSPFSTQWSPLPQDDMTFILQTLKDKLVSSGFQKKEERGFRPWRKKGIQSDAPKATSSEENGWTDLSVRRQLAIGINEVTRALERNDLQLLLVCKSVKPQHMTEHLIALSASREVPACQVPWLSTTLCEPMGLKSVLALGFRRPQDGQTLLFTDVIQAISPRVPALRVTWLQRPEGPEEAEKRGVKRKLKEEEVQDVCTLQPLKVKKIVANPNKKRKLKLKKKS